MSKLPLWGPPELGAGSALGPRQPVLRVVGFPAGSPEAQLLANAHSGELKNFYLGQSRNHALGITEYTSKTIERDGVRYQYTNQSGQEIITMEVHPKKAEQILKPEPVDFWDWAIVDIEFDATGTYGYFSAFMVDPYRPQLTPTYTDPIEGVARDWYSWSYGGAFGDPPLIAFPDYVFPVARQRESGAIQRASLRLDLRPFRGMPVVVFDIYGHLDTLAGETAYTQGAQDAYFVQSSPVTYETIDSVVLPAGDPDPFGPSSDVDDYPADWPSPYPSKNVPPGDPQPGQVDAYWGYLAGDPSTHTRTFIYSDPVAGPDIFHTRWNRIRYREQRVFWPAYNYTTYELPVPGGQRRPATVYARTFKGDAADVYSEWSGGAYYRQWEDSRIYPDRWPLSEMVPKLSIPAYDYPDDTTAANHFGDTRLGRVTIDLRTGGVSLSPT